MKLWELLIAHNHWFTISFGSKSIKLCARCTGVILGFISLSILSINLNLTFFFSLPITYQIILCILLAIPVILDWVTQSWRIRVSNNKLRLITGFSEGVGISLLALIAIPLFYKILIIVSIAGLTIGISMLK
ncbi:MAG: DUF2085 domain-containing protein [Nitrososphaerales archaeon]